MRSGASKTAEATCLFRAWEHRRPVDRRLISDPFARSFLGVGGRRALQLGRPWLVDGVDRLASGLVTYVSARHRFIDDALHRSLLGDVGQVLLLGAGYDARAWRFADRIGARPVIELDHPATSGRKAAIVARRGGGWPPVQRRVVAVDLHRESLSHALARGGVHAGRPMFVAWEGVSMYLERHAVERTLRTLATAAPGSLVALDLWDPTELPGARGRLRGVGLRGLAMLGEPIRFGLAPGKAAAFFGSLGFDLVDRAGPEELARRYRLDGRRLYPSTWCALLTVR